MAETGILIDNGWKEAASGRMIDVVAPNTGHVDRAQHPFICESMRKAARASDQTMSEAGRRAKLQMMAIE